MVPEVHHGPIQAHLPDPAQRRRIRPPGVQHPRRPEGRGHPRAGRGPVPRGTASSPSSAAGRRISASLGTFLFSQAAAENEERHQRLVMIWASRNLNGIIAEGPRRRSDRPKLFRRLVDVPDEPPATPHRRTPPAAIRPAQADGTRGPARPTRRRQRPPGGAQPPSDPAPSLPNLLTRVQSTAAGDQDVMATEPCPMRKVNCPIDPRREPRLGTWPWMVTGAESRSSGSLQVAEAGTAARRWRRTRPGADRRARIGPPGPGRPVGRSFG